MQTLPITNKAPGFMTGVPEVPYWGVEGGGQRFYQEKRFLDRFLRVPSLPILRKRDCHGRNGTRGSLALLFFKLLK